MPPPSDSAHSFTLRLPDLVAIGGAPLYLTGEDSLRLTVFNALSGVVVTVTGRTLAIGESKPTRFDRTLTPATNRTASTLLINPGDGWLLGVQVTVTSGTPIDGQTYARLSLQRGDASVALDQFTLVSDTVTVGKPLTWPGGFARGPLDGAGALRLIAGTQPAAGAEISETVPAGARWQLLSFKARFVASAAVANRSWNLLLDDGATRYLTAQTNATATPASVTLDVVWAPGLADSRNVVTGNINLQTEPLPNPTELLAGHRIRTSTNLLQAGDQWDTIEYVVLEWLEA